MKFARTVLFVGFFLLFPFQSAQTISNTQYWMKIRAKDKFQRSLIANTGVSIEATVEDYVMATGSLEELKAVEKLGLLDVSFEMTEAMDFPQKDSAYHNYVEMTDELRDITQQHSSIAQMLSIGKTQEGRDVWALRISGNLEHADQLPGLILMGGHHAREHLSVELPIFYARYLLTEYANGNPRIKNLIDGRDIHIIPAVNPDGLEFDVATGYYKSWRKNRRLNRDGTYGVDLNRNYGHHWGESGASSNPRSDVYQGEAAFSEPETQNIKNYVEAHNNISILLSFHTYSQLILFPWGYTFDPIENNRDFQVHDTMAKKMAEWNDYTPQQSSELYISSGDTTDWAYGEHKIISFTFELDPGPWTGGGFYPGANIIPEVVQKNLEPVLYLLNYADNPYRVLDNKNNF